MRHQIRGKVISKKRKPVPGVRVEVCDIENTVDDYLTYTATSHDGSFLINLEEEMIRDLFPDRYPDLYFKVWCGDELLASTEDSVVWNTKSRWAKIVVKPVTPPRCLDRHIFLKIERLHHYSPAMPADHAVGQARWGLDCMRNKGHEDGRIPDSEIEAREVDAVVYREYLDSAYLVPKPDKLIVADINEPLYDHRVPGTVIYARPCQRLKIHVWNDDDVPHSLHAHGLRYGISSDGTWPFGTQASNLGGRSDAICPGDTWVYTFDITEEMYGAWPFHDYTHFSNVKIEQGLFGGIVVLGYCDRPPRPFRFRRGILAEVYDGVEKVEGRNFHPREKKIDFDRASPPFMFNPQIHFKRLKEDSKKILAHRLDFVEEYVNAEVAKPTKHIPTDHVPVFFHKMVRGHSHEHEHEPEPPRPPRPPDFGLDLDLVLERQRRLLDLGLVRPDLNDLVIGPLVPDKEVKHIPSLCINGRSFVGNTPTIVGRAGQRIRWYVFNLDISSNGHNFHAHGMRWRFGGENIDTRSFGPGESFIVEATIPPVLLLNEEQARMQQPLYRPRTAKLFRLRGDFLFHCHEQDHLLKGMAGLVRSRQSVWLTQEMADAIRRQTGLPLDDGSNNCPEVKPESCVDEELVGRWEEVAGRPGVLLMHSVLLPNTRQVLFWGRTRADQSRIWDYSTPAGSYLPTAAHNQPADLVGGDVNVSNMWSASHCLLDTPEGIVLIHGGLAGNSAFTFDPATLTWAQVGDTVGNRFYATTLVLADGRAPTLFGNVETIEIYTHGANWGAPIAMPASMFHHQFYPWTYLLPDGRLFIAGPHVPSQRFDINNPAGVEDFNSPHGDRSTGGEKGSSVLLILRPPDYEPIVYRMGGNPPAVQQSAEEINLGVPSPAWSNLPDLQNARAAQFTATLLPDGRVFIAGGIGVLGDPDGGPCEIFDPRNPGAGWVVGPAMRFVRTYHSSFILLLDGSILSGGAPPDADNENDYTEHERFFPSYFDRVRPLITGAPATINYGGNFNVNTPAPLDISEVVLMRPGAVTHGFNQTQRGIELVITGTGPGVLNVETPPNANLAPPGWYLLFILDFDRTPSEGRWIRVTP